MAITDAQAVSFGLLAMFAVDMYGGPTEGMLNPPADPRIAASGWTIVAYLTAQDVVIPPEGGSSKELINWGRRVFFGYLARNNADPSSYVAAIRGTRGLVEWFIDGHFALVPHVNQPGVLVEQGFSGIYATMSLADPASGATTYQHAVDGIAATVGTGTLVVTGHSLGSALATYLTADLAARLGSRVSACLFASPRTGNRAWVDLFAATVKDYRLFNYILDIVPYVPTGNYAALPNATVIQPATAKAAVNLDIACGHRLLCYCAMIDFAATLEVPLTGKDDRAKACIGPPPMSDTALALATLINTFGIGTETARMMIRTLHAAGKAS